MCVIIDFLFKVVCVVFNLSHPNQCSICGVCGVYVNVMLGLCYVLKIMIE